MRAETIRGDEAMESRTALRGSFVSKRLAAIVLVIAAIVLGMTTAYAAHMLAAGANGSAAAASVQFAAGPAWDDTNRRHGAQSLGGPPSGQLGYREPSGQRGGPKD
jgi:hypothetical protein